MRNNLKKKPHIISFWIDCGYAISYIMAIGCMAGIFYTGPFFSKISIRTAPAEKFRASSEHGGPPRTKTLLPFSPRRITTFFSGQHDTVVLPLWLFYSYILYLSHNYIAQFLAITWQPFHWVAKYVSRTLREKCLETLLQCVQHSMYVKARPAHHW